LSPGRLRIETTAARRRGERGGERGRVFAMAIARKLREEGGAGVEIVAGAAA